jgi:perosamine synthetase
MRKLIPVSEPDLSRLEKKYLNKVFDSGWISSTGNFLDKFQTSWADNCNTTHALAVSNGTVAIHLILLGLEIKPGDEVIVPSLTFVATANAVRYVGATPIFADVNLETWCLDRKSVETLITSRTKAIIFVALYGNTSGVEEIEEFCSKNGIFLIEDAAESPFGSLNGKPAGSFGIAASFSFYGNKIITSGEGGAVVTSDTNLYNKMKKLRDQGMDPEKRYYFSTVGYNYRITNLQCAILCGQLERSQEMLTRRREIFDVYNLGLNDMSEIFRPIFREGVVESPWLYTIGINGKSVEASKELATYLKVSGIDSRPVFIPIHTLPPYLTPSVAELPNTEFIAQRGISLPTSSKMKLSEVRRVISIIKSYLNSTMS